VLSLFDIKQAKITNSLTVKMRKEGYIYRIIKINSESNLFAVISSLANGLIFVKVGNDMKI
jgi:hypothetical protein